jgi:hypothetical protein
MRVQTARLFALISAASIMAACTPATPASVPANRSSDAAAVSTAGTAAYDSADAKLKFPADWTLVASDKDLKDGNGLRLQAVKGSVAAPEVKVELIALPLGMRETETATNMTMYTAFALAYSGKFGNTPKEYKLHDGLLPGFRMDPKEGLAEPQTVWAFGGIGEKHGYSLMLTADGTSFSEDQAMAIINSLDIKGLRLNGPKAPEPVMPALPAN